MPGIGSPAGTQRLIEEFVGVSGRKRRRMDGDRALISHHPHGHGPVLSPVEPEPERRRDDAL